MSGELHEISIRIGRLEAQQERQISDHVRTHDMLEKIDAKVDTLTLLPPRVVELERHTASMQTVIDIHERYKNRAAGVLSIIAALASGAWAFLLKKIGT